jgi:predicted nucleic acid-binding protein
LADYFADSFALVALLEENPRYTAIFRRREIVTSALNVLEVYSTLLRRVPKAEAREIAIRLLAGVADVPDDVALNAAEFRATMRARHRDCSYIDAWGFAAAQALGLPFLTGDPVFKGLTGVEFVR